MPKSRTHQKNLPQNQPKVFCKRGHLLSETRYTCTGPSGNKTSYCRLCHNEAWMNHYNRDDDTRRRRKYDLTKKYGLRIEDYDLLLISQDYKCAICEVTFTKTPKVDHNHKTGKVRGLLCTGCNLHLGRLESELYPKMVAYLIKYSVSSE